MLVKLWCSEGGSCIVEMMRRKQVDEIESMAGAIWSIYMFLHQIAANLNP
jgi:hypothetical protein